MNGVAILYDGLHDRAECLFCGEITCRVYRAFPKSGGNFPIHACSQEHADEIYCSMNLQSIADKVLQERERMNHGYK